MNAIQNEINERLSDVFRENVGEVKQLMDRHSVLISGSTIVECALGEKWDHHNPSEKKMVEGPIIEFYSPISEMRKFHKAIKKFISIDCCKLQYPHQCPWHRQTTTNMIYGMGIACNKSYDKLVEYVNSIFLFDICKNFYRVRNGIDELYVNSLEASSIISRKSSFAFPDNSRYKYDFKGALIDCLYYKSRGFEFSVDDNANMYEYIISNSIHSHGEKVYHEFHIESTNETRKMKYTVKKIKAEYKEVGYRIRNGKVCGADRKEVEGDIVKFYTEKDKEYVAYVYEVCNEKTDELRELIDGLLKQTKQCIQFVGDNKIALPKDMIERDCKIGRLWGCKHCNSSICPLLVSGSDEDHCHVVIFNDKYEKINIIFRFDM
jgi:hypothetical protein